MSGCLYLGIDIGTSSSKGVVVRAGGEVVAAAQRPHGLSLPQPGWAEHDAEGVWWTDFAELCRHLLGQVDRAAIAAVGVSGIGPTVLPASATSEPLRPAILYGIDTRATAEIDDLTRRYGADQILQRGGSTLTTQAVGPKLLWLRRHEPEVWVKTRRLFMCNSYLVHRLTGEYILDHHSASQSDPLYELATNTWIADWWRDIAPGVEQPRLVWPGEVAGHVTADASRALGLLAGTPVVAGTIDAWSEAVSVGVKRPGDLMLMYGSTMFFVDVTASAVRDVRLWSTCGCFPQTTTLAAGLATSGSLTGWLQSIVGGLSFEQLTHEAAAVPPASEGLVVLPYFAGERTPIHDPDARGLIIGLTLRHGRGHLYRALLEGTAYAVRHNMEVLTESAPPQRVVAVGGGTAGDLWMQIVSDVAGLLQEVPRVTVGASFGDAFLAAVGVGAARVEDEWNPPARVIEPDETTAPTYDELYRVFRALYPAAREQMHELARVQRGGDG